MVDGIRNEYQKKKKYISRNNNKDTLTNVFMSLDIYIINIFYSHNNNKNKYKKNIYRTIIMTGSVKCCLNNPEHFISYCEIKATLKR